ncbi:hypothetical protein FB567DRAFT_80664 [Paraphoma chrysanthemicola]|uniref:Uncharacterized protein n=1 Tax=Paraphoma chrysanthemicola TaxID=798071 RepID=A0A8K0VY09_9PLEO|nr:hypothetical protein FB567DRAFT_80664 [Paraphoma chrysanthemicola]
MKLIIIAVAFAAVVAATPHPWAAPQASLLPTPSRTQKGNRTRKNPHKEPVPTFKTGCECAKPIVPLNLLSVKERCLMEHAAAMGCYLGSGGSCPSPAPACGLGILDGVPFTH